MNEDLLKLGEDYWEAVLRWEPTEATYLGDYRYNDRLPEIGAKARSAREDEIRGFQRRLQEIQPSDEQERISWDVLRLKLVSAQEEERHQFYQWNLDQLMGPQVWLLELLNYHPLKTEKDFRDLATRYRAFLGHLDQYTANLQEGIANGRTSPRIVVDRVIGQLESILATPVESSPLLPCPEAVPQALRDDIQVAIVNSVYPAYRRLLGILKSYPGREAVGLCALPGGEEAYRFRISHHTTTEMTAHEIHHLGLESVRGLRREMEEIARRLGHTGDLAAFRNKVQQDPALHNTSREELLEGYRRILDQVTALLPRYFGRLPKSECVVKAIEEYREKDCVAAFYYGPPEDFSRPGIFYANTYAPETRARYTMTALTVHEAVPGHHLQIALAMELGELPHFRRHGSFTAYVEGWALYTERLGVEMGMYGDLLSHFGMLTYQMWRSARLVVDSGMHALGWTRQQAIDFFNDNVGLPEGETANEIDRYIMWPGQALAYAVGMREIMALREEAMRKLGADFNLSAFHDEILRFGALPLSTLRTLIGTWIERNQKAVLSS